MNVTRGLFRLWLVFAVLFVVTTVASSFAMVQREFDQAASERLTADDFVSLVPKIAAQRVGYQNKTMGDART